MFPDRLTLWIIKTCVTGAVLLLMYFIGYYQGAQHWKAEYLAEVKANAVVLDDLAAKTQRAATLAAEASKAAAIERTANDKRFDDATRQADKARTDLAAALRAGTQRLQPWWDCGMPAAAEGDAAGPAGGQDASADLRAESASRVIDIADEADRTVTWLQAELASTRKACGVE